MEMWDGGGPLDTGYDEPNSVSGKEYLKMSSNQRNDYHKKLFDDIEAETSTIDTKTIYRYKGTRYGSCMAMKSAYLVDIQNERRNRNEAPLSQDQLTRQLDEFHYEKYSTEIIGLKEATAAFGNKKLYVVTTSKYKEMMGKSYTSLDEIAAAMDAIDRNADYLIVDMKDYHVKAGWKGGKGAICSTRKDAIDRYVEDNYKKRTFVQTKNEFYKQMKQEFLREKPYHWVHTMDWSQKVQPTKLVYQSYNKKYSDMNAKIYETLDDIADAMDAIDSVPDGSTLFGKTKPELKAIKAKAYSNRDDFENALLKGLGHAPSQGGSGKKKSDLAQYTKSEPTTSAQQYNGSKVEPLFYQKSVDDIRKLMAYIEEHKMHESVFDHHRVKPEYVKEVVDIYNRILDPQESDKLMLTQALDHILEHLALIIKTYKERKSDDLEIYRNFLGMRFNLKGIFS